MTADVRSHPLWRGVDTRRKRGGQMDKFATKFEAYDLFGSDDDDDDDDDGNKA